MGAKADGRVESIRSKREQSPPHIPKPCRTEFCVARGMLDRTVAEPVLDEPCVMTRIGQGIAAGVAQHVSMNPKRQLGALANGFHRKSGGSSATIITKSFRSQQALAMRRDEYSPLA